MGLGHWEGHKCGGVFYFFFFSFAKKKINIPSQVYTECAKCRKGEKGRICMEKMVLKINEALEGKEGKFLSQLGSCFPTFLFLTLSLCKKGRHLPSP